MTVTSEPQRTAARPTIGEAGRTSAFLALVAGALAMGLSPVFVRLADVGPFTSAFWRVALALPALYLWMKLDERGRPGERNARFTQATVLAGLAFSGDLFLWHLAIVNTTIANATFFATTAPLWVVLVTWLVLRRRVARGVVLGLSLCLAGGAALVWDSLSLAPGRLPGDAFGLGTAVFFGLYFLAVERARRETRAARVTFETTVVTSAVLFAVALVMEGRLLPASLEGLLALLVIAWVSHAGGQGLLAIALGRLPAVFSSLVIFLEAIAAAFFAWVLLGESLGPAQISGGALILAGIWLARPRREIKEEA
ncbi:DMT family transporter [Chelatococcus sp. SYSU_G07232]|uniref:DMT family transporter n=1 Tax=Chelatococcus albus TaxID=3047466 RepID=A0ABT7AFZ9_9HYPH|nr:DMT family transporter [Chelatococcus sp. SYSU_G07232]MDJ1158298.1 DMT family transporter [Chelatococcus sp. SYSU_G07232]